jgi:hypothetical protein
VKASVTRLQAVLDRAHWDIGSPNVSIQTVSPPAGGAFIAEETKKLANFATPVVCWTRMSSRRRNSV